MGYDPTYGARPLKRVIQKRLVDPLALGLLKGDYAAGDAIVVDAGRGEPPALAFTRTRRRRAAERAGRRSPSPSAAARGVTVIAIRMKTPGGLGAVGRLVVDLQRPAPERGPLDRDLAALDVDPAARALRRAERDRLAQLALAHVVREDLGAVDEAAADEAHAPRRRGLARLQPQRERA